MRRFRAHLDDATVDRLLDGRVEAADAPPGYQAVAAHLREAASGFPTPTDTGVAAARLAAVAQEGAAPTRLSGRPTVVRSLGAKAAIVAGTLAFSATAAAAATGNLPEPAQDGLSRAAEVVGVTLPRAHDHDGSPSTTTTPPAAQQGKDVSGTARTTDSTGRDKGTEVSGTARDGNGVGPTTTSAPPSTTRPTAPTRPTTTSNPNGNGNGKGGG